MLEHGYLDLVERPHGLPVGNRQAPRVGGNGHVYRDVDLPAFLVQAGLEPVSIEKVNIPRIWSLVTCQKD